MTRPVQRDTTLPWEELPCFSGLDRDLLGILGARAVDKTFSKGTILVREGSVLEHVVILREGRLRLYCVDDEGQERTCRLVAPGECFCFAPCHQRFPSPVTIECMEECRIVMLSRSLLGRLVGRKVTRNRLPRVSAERAAKYRDAGLSPDEEWMTIELNRLPAEAAGAVCGGTVAGQVRAGD